MMDGLPDIEPFRERFQKLDSEMMQDNFYTNQSNVALVTREHQQLGLLLGKYELAEKIERTILENFEILSDPGVDIEIKILAEEENVQLSEHSARVKQEMLQHMLPISKSDGKNIILEIRAGTGGDEASLFAGDLSRMYRRFAEKNGWSTRDMGSSLSEAGGFKEVSFLVSGDDVYKTLKYESGVHRVQRIPVTEANGRIHTSTSTVAVLPEAEEVDILIDPSDLVISVCRASGPGGQGVNTTDSAVQILHKPTGMIVQCADERSQLKNKNKAMKVLRSRLLQLKKEEEEAKYAASRRGQIGTGDRSERIRTYNFPQSRVTDHRIGFTSHNLEGILNGELDELAMALQNADNQAKVDALMLGKQAPSC
jgi:peptide chain release factor 1